MKRFAVVPLVLVSLFAASANAAGFADLTIDLTGIDTAAIAIGTAMLAVMAVFWGIRKIMSLVG